MLCGKDNQPSQTEKHSSEMQAKAIKIQGFFFLIALFFSYLSDCTGSWLWHVGSLIFAVACKLLVAACGIYSFLTRSQALCTGGVESQPLDHLGSPYLLVTCVYFLCFSALQSYENLIQRSTLQPQVTLHKLRENLNFAFFKKYLLQNVLSRWLIIMVVKLKIKVGICFVTSINAYFQAMRLP